MQLLQHPFVEGILLVLIRASEALSQKSLPCQLSPGKDKGLEVSLVLCVFLCLWTGGTMALQLFKITLSADYFLMDLEKLRI